MSNWLIGFFKAEDGEDDNSSRQCLLIRKLLLWIYSTFIDHRPYIRNLIATKLYTGINPHIPANQCGHFKYLLDLLFPILVGMRSDTAPSLSVKEDLLINCLLPLHKPNNMILWRDQVPIISLYHESLTRCISQVASTQSLLEDAIVGRSLLILTIDSLICHTVV